MKNGALSGFVIVLARGDSTTFISMTPATWLPGKMARPTLLRWWFALTSTP
jgi:hypothetical protein